MFVNTKVLEVEFQGFMLGQVWGYLDENGNWTGSVGYLVRYRKAVG